MGQVCKPILFSKSKPGKPTVEYEQNLIESLRNVSPLFNRTITYCLYRGLNENCEDFFHEIVTEEGICYTFNALDGEEIYREET